MALLRTSEEAAGEFVYTRVLSMCLTWLSGKITQAETQAAASSRRPRRSELPKFHQAAEMCL